ncbi:MAG: prolipoprotein diacylglyceryl transferase [Bacteroidales bacterium]|nr:prolipoprotein diacylglyceryl transferase [Bacteroidales bacterium]
MLPLLAPPLLAIPFPAFDPVLVSVGPFAIRWYALAYIVGLLGGWWLSRRLVANARLWGGTSPMQPSDLDDALLWIALGVILGGRLGFVLVYNFDYYSAHPLDALMVWRGGMSFHGGFLGAVLAMVLFARSRGISVWSLFDVVAAVVPIGLFLGRIANFINGELWGRVADVPWAVIFPTGGPEPRHPSQLYQAGLEGLLLFAVLMGAVALLWFGSGPLGLVIALAMVFNLLAAALVAAFQTGLAPLPGTLQAAPGEGTDIAKAPWAAPPSAASASAATAPKPKATVRSPNT